MITTILFTRGKGPLAKKLLKHPVKGTRALLRARRLEKMMKSPAGMVALGALVAVPVGMMAMKRVRAR